MTFRKHILKLNQERNMINPWQSVAVVTSSLALSFTVSQLNPAQAATVIYNLTGTIEEGLLEGESFSGTFSFDDASLEGSDYEIFKISDLKFNFLGSTFTAADAEPDSDPTVEFSDGNFLGLTFSVPTLNAELYLVPGSSDATDAIFAYIGTEDAGFGSIEYTVVPEPFTLLGTSTALGFGLFFKQKLKRKKED